MRILVWHVHGAWTTSLVHGPHTYLVPVLPDRGPDGLGRAQTYDWPDRALEVTPDEARDAEVDVVVLQRPRELEVLARDWLGGRRPGIDVPAVYVEHDVPQGRVNDLRHVTADRDDVLLVHVTHYNDLLWDAGSTRTVVVEHGIVDPGYRYTGEVPHAAVVVNEPDRRGRVTGTDLLARFAESVPLDLFGMGTERHCQPRLRGLGDVAHGQLHAALAARRVYLHPYRWTSLGLALLEAMHLGMPVVAVASTDAPRAVLPGTGALSSDVDELVARLRDYVCDPDLARAHGAAARLHARRRFGVERFLHDWDRVLKEVTA